MSDAVPVAPAGSGYVFAVCQDLDDPYICGALHVERDDELFMFADDKEAALAAERDGFSLIHGMEDVPDGIYLDTEENRAAILRNLQEYLQYQTAAHTQEQEPETGPAFTL